MRIKAMRPAGLGFGPLFEKVRDAVIVADVRTQQIVLWNQAASNIFGYSPAEALKMRLKALVPQHLKAKHQTGMLRYAETGHGPYIDSERPLELPALRKDGQQIHIELSLSPIESVEDTNKGGRFVLAIVRDITERKRAEKELKESEERLRLLVEGVKDYAIFMLDPQGRVASWNEGAHRIKGYRTEEILGRHFSIFYTEEDVKRGHLEEELSIAAAEGSYEEEGIRVRKDGSRFWASVLITALRDEGGRLRGFSKVTRNITQRKRAEERLQEANRRLSELASLRADFTAMVAHEIGSPLASVRGFLDMLATGELKPTEQIDILAKIRTEIDRLSTLVADVRSAATIEREDFALTPRRTSDDDLLEDATRFAEMLPGGHPLLVEATIEEPVWADRYRIGQVLRNLLSNAAKYSPDGAPIELRMIRGKSPGRVRIEVVDHGRGVHPDDVERIFEKFGRGRGQYGRKTYGVGLGLYLSRRIVRAHGSELTLDSAPGTGSTFGFELETAR